MLGRTFKTVWAVDFEFRCPDGRHPDIVCMVAKEINTGRVIRLHGDELHNFKQCPFDTGMGSLVITYYGTAEAHCFISLGWKLPHNHLDLWVEFRHRTNGIVSSANSSLLSALKYFNKSGITERQKKDMRDLILNKSVYTQEEMTMILDYCQSDVEALEKLYPEFLPENRDDLNRMLLRGHCMLNIAKIEDNGIPVDVDLCRDIECRRQTIRKSMIARVDVDYGVYFRESFSTELFLKSLERNRIEWPRSSKGVPMLDKDTFREMAHKHPQLEKLYQLRRALSVLRKFSLHLGGDGRVHCNLRPFASITGRNQPSTTAYPFGLPACLRGLIKPKPGSGLAYIDFRQEEFAIAAALSKDPNMIEAYKSGDPYLTFGKQAGLIPEDATKQSHSKDRARIKQLTLAVQYCMSPWGLARKLDCTTQDAEELLNLHKRTYRTFWEFIENFNNTAWLNMTTTTILGWPLNLSHNTNPRTVQNFLMQATASDILRLACCIANDYGVKVCATVHDALLIESNLEKMAEDAAATYEAMRRAAEYVLGGFVLKADIKLIRYPERYQDEADTVMWDTLMRELGRLKNDG